ncbi:hypothetical protein PMAYCL1PPCAC_26433 [Pristionchus mayeri]|uniref:Uncharacterized protein n=1 Tax=Pristionchus mayeri TaxID=1317129 RepID=A0AAN5D426_9BILA|nr:hypothetical protein PMAYCL1PPCAC_26433 [Pristionchus mayeri]
MDNHAEGDIPKNSNCIEERIANGDQVSDTDVQEFIDQIEKDKSYQSHLYAFMRREHLLKGARHVQFLQNAFISATTINRNYYDNIFWTMSSIIDRLSNEELEKALVSSGKYFDDIRRKKREYVADFKDVINCEKSEAMITSRLLLLGPIKVGPELSVNLNESYDDPEKRSKWITTVTAMPLPLHKMLLEGSLCGPPILLMNLFSMKEGSLYSNDNFSKPMECLVMSGIFPLHKLLNKMLKDSQNFKFHFLKIFRCNALKGCIESVKSREEFEETVQSVISALAILVSFGAIGRDYMIGLLGFLKEMSGESIDDCSWLTKYKNHETVGKWIGVL